MLTVFDEVSKGKYIRTAVTSSAGHSSKRKALDRVEDLLANKGMF